MYLLEGVKPLEDAFYMDVKIKTVFLREGTENRPVFTETDTIIPVSYTHLDVYKRQAIYILP